MVKSSRSGSYLKAAIVGSTFYPGGVRPASTRNNKGTIRCSFDQIYNKIREFEHRSLSKLYMSVLLGVSDSDVEARLRAKPLEEDHYTFSPRSEHLQQFVTQHGLDGRASQVHIV
jgi:hypothetical protein